MCAGESSAIHPTPFVLADVDGETPWAVEGTDCLRCVCGNCQVVWCDCCVAPNTNPLGLPNIGGAVDRRGPFHMSCWEFPPGCVELRMVRIDEGQAGATDENRLLGSWGVGCESFWCRKGFRVPPMELGLFAGVVPICVGPLVSIVVCMWGTLDGFGGPTSCMAQRRCIRWLQAGQLYGAFGPMPSRWMSCKQTAHVVGCAAAAVVAAGGVVAPCVVQCGGVGQVDLGGCLGPYDKEADDRDWAGGNKQRGGSPTSCLWRAF